MGSFTNMDSKQSRDVFTEAASLSALQTARIIYGILRSEQIKQKHIDGNSMDVDSNYYYRQYLLAVKKLDVAVSALRRLRGVYANWQSRQSQGKKDGIQIIEDAIQQIE